MPQNAVPLAIPLAPVNRSGVQEQINLGATNNIIVGSPGGPVVFAHYGAKIGPALYGGFPRSVVKAK